MIGHSVRVRTAADAGTGTEGRRRVAVVGAGAGGVAVAVDLARSGTDVTLWDRWRVPVGDGAVAYDGVLGRGRLSTQISDPDLADVVASADVVVVATLATARDFLATELAPCLRPGQVVVVGCGGAVAASLTRAARPAVDEPLVGELSCLPYSSRLVDDGVVIRATRRVRAAAVVPTDYDAFVAALPADWVARPTADVLHCALSNPNYVLHPAAMVVNLASYDRGEEVDREGRTPRTEAIVAGLDAERRQILDRLGYPAESVVDLMAELRPMRPPAALPPEKLLGRFVDEDVVVGIGLFAWLARLLGVDVPVVAAIRGVLAAALPAVGAGIDEHIQMFDREVGPLLSAAAGERGRLR